MYFKVPLFYHRRFFFLLIFGFTDFDNVILCLFRFLRSFLWYSPSLLLWNKFGAIVVAPIEIVVVVVAPPTTVIIVVVPAISCCLFICRPSKKLDFGDCQNTLEDANNKLRSCIIYIMDICLPLKNGIFISSIHCEFCDHSPCDSICDSSFAMFPFILAKQI